MYILNRMIGWIEINFLKRLRWRHFIWMLIVAGVAYVCLPFFYAASYTWDLLHPVCQLDGQPIEEVQSVFWRDEEYGPVHFLYLPPQNGRVIIMVGGRCGSVQDWQTEIDIFKEYGFGFAILPDPSCMEHPASLGIKEKSQIMAMTTYLHTRDEVHWIGAAGFSAGASALALAIPEMPDLQAAVLMGNFADLQSEIMYADYPLGSFGWLAQRSVLCWYRVFTGYAANQVNPMEAYENYPALKLLLIHGEQEAQRTQAEIQYQVAKLGGAKEVQLWIVPDAGHGMYETVASEDYVERLYKLFLSE
ncbi:MAG: hypothetical protein JEZ00_10310 [Anaerolineaceae bacterium]|nr:hypothetical protein [Anaerolineaceae bacterium]